MQVYREPSYFDRLLAHILIVALVIQPLWAISQRYRWDPEYLYAVFASVAELLRPGEMTGQGFSTPTRRGR